MPGLFSIFNTSKSGLFAQQTALNVTSHNIANAGTDGYSRQRAQLVTTLPYTMPSIDNAASAGQLGTGVTVDAINRIRDTFIDYQYRVQNSVNGECTAEQKYLSQVEGIINEPTDTGLSALLGKFFNSWQSLSSTTDNTNTVAQEAYQLANELNSMDSQLTSVETNTETEIKNSVVNVNSLIEKISNLNKQIINIKESGNNPNDLMDSRDLLLDQLSDELGIDVTQEGYEGVDVTSSNLGKKPDTDDNGTAPTLGGKTLNLVSSDSKEETATFSYVSSIEKTGEGQYKVVYYKKGDVGNADDRVELNVNMTADQAKELEKSRVLWADKDGNAYKASIDADGKTVTVNDSDRLEDGNTVDFKDLALFKPPSGELKGYMQVQDNIMEYQTRLDNFAKALAFSVNAIVSQSDKWTADGEDGSPEGGINNFFVNGDKKDYSDYKEEDENGITAANITFNVELLNNPSKIKTGTKYDSKGDALGTSTDPNRAVAVAQLANALLNISDTDSISSRENFVKDVFSTDSDLNNIYTIKNADGGLTLDNYFNNLVNVIGSDSNKANTQLKNQTAQLAVYEQSRESISGVSMDEEMTNLIQFEHCYQANAKAISTVDELLDVVINGLKR